MKEEKAKCIFAATMFGIIGLFVGFLGGDMAGENNGIKVGKAISRYEWEVKLIECNVGEYYIVDPKTGVTEFRIKECK